MGEFTEPEEVDIDEEWEEQDSENSDFGGGSEESVDTVSLRGELEEIQVDEDSEASVRMWDNGFLIRIVI